MLNIVAVQGRLVRDPEARRTGSGVSVTNFTVAVERNLKEQDGTKKIDYIECVAWRNTADFVCKYLKKGTMAIVNGRLESRKWTDKSGASRTNWEIQVENVYFGESKKKDSDFGQTTNSYAPAESYATENKPTDFAYPYPGEQTEFAVIDDDDSQLPF